MEAEAPRAETPKSKGLEVKSPMVGTFYSAPEPGAQAVRRRSGQRVAKGQIVCIIEAMKIMNEIESEYDGVVTEVLADERAPGRVRPGAVPHRPERVTMRSIVRSASRPATPAHV